MMSCGVKPVYIFDGKPPALKSEEVDARSVCVSFVNWQQTQLAKRILRRAQAQVDLERAQESGTILMLFALGTIVMRLMRRNHGGYRQVQ
jgi:hypothetical protein